VALSLTEDIQAASRRADPTERRLFNQAFFERLEIDSEEVSGQQLAEPFAQLLAQDFMAEALRGRAGQARGRVEATRAQEGAQKGGQGRLLAATGNPAARGA